MSMMNRKDYTCGNDFALKRERLLNRGAVRASSVTI